VNAVTADVNTIMGQMTEMPQRKKHIATPFYIE